MNMRYIASLQKWHDQFVKSKHW